MPLHDSLFLLRNVLAAPRLVYLLRTAPCYDSPELPMYDAVLWDSLAATLNVDIDHNRWTQASLPVRFGRPWYYFAGNVCLPGFSCKYHGAHFRPTSNACTHNRGQWHCFRHVHLDKVGNHFERSGIYSTSTVTATACLG